MNIDHSYLALDPKLYTEQSPDPLASPKAGHFHTALAQKLGLDADFWQKNWVSILGGALVPEGCKPLAMAYAGHQFGVWAGQLGDGRGLLLTQVRDRQGKLWDMHLKGAGQTPYSRMGDGRAVLRSVIREHLGSIALGALGVASSTSLGFVTSDTPVRRERMEQGAAMLRVADTHIRLGHFEWVNAYAPELLPEFANYCIRTYFAKCVGAERPVLAFAQQVVKHTAKTIADWQLVGFCHGVMNTDNLSVTGSTLDFGPFAFMERFDPAWVFNHTDTHGRYTYQNQPAVAHWNLSIFLGQLSRLDGIEKPELGRILDTFEPAFLDHYKAGIAKKVGLQNTEAAFGWSMDWLQLLQDEKLDYTNSFRALSNIDNPDTKRSLRNQLDDTDNIARFDTLIDAYTKLADTQGLENRKTTMDGTNPVYVLRTHMAQTAIALAEAGDMSEVKRLFKLLSSPFEKSELAKPADTAPPAKNAEQVVLSCSS